MNKNHPEVLLITGPSGSGKTTLAQHIAEKAGWRHIEEDTYWLANGWRNQARTTEREATIRQQVSGDLQTIYVNNESTVLEFLLKNSTPNSLATYTHFLNTSRIPYRVIVLKPSHEAIVERIKKRGRAIDIDDMDDCSKVIANQLIAVDSKHIQPEWIIDTTSMSIDQIYSKHILQISL